MVSVSSNVQWAIIKKNSCFLHKSGPTIFTAEPNNLNNRPTYRNSGLIHKKTVGVESAPDNKGVVLVQKRKVGQNKPAQMYTRVTYKKWWRRNLKGIANSVKGYRSDLLMPALRRASAIHMSQKRASYVKKKRTPRVKTT